MKNNKGYTVEYNEILHMSETIPYMLNWNLFWIPALIYLYSEYPLEDLTKMQ